VLLPLRQAKKDAVFSVGLSGMMETKEAVAMTIRRVLPPGRGAMILPAGPAEIAVPVLSITLEVPDLPPEVSIGQEVIPLLEVSAGEVVVVAAVQEVSTVVPLLGVQAEAAGAAVLSKVKITIKLSDE